MKVIDKSHLKQMCKKFEIRFCNFLIRYLKVSLSSVLSRCSLVEVYEYSYPYYNEKKTIKVLPLINGMIFFMEYIDNLKGDPSKYSEVYVVSLRDGSIIGNYVTKDK